MKDRNFSTWNKKIMAENLEFYFVSENINNEELLSHK